MDYVSPYKTQLHLHKPGQQDVLKSFKLIYVILKMPKPLNTEV